MRLFRLVFALSLIGSPAAARSVEEARRSIVDESIKYLNIPYLWGGQHPKTGLDCSGFVQMVYRQIGLYLPRVSRDQFAQTRYLRARDPLPGDLIFFSMKKPKTKKIDHVGIYMGKGHFIHAGFSTGIHINRVDNPYYFPRIVSIRRYQGF